MAKWTRASTPGGDDPLIALGLKGEAGEGRDCTVWYTHWDNDSADPIAGALRASRWDGLSVTLKQELSDEYDRYRLALVGGADFATSGPRGTNTVTGASAKMGPATPALALPLEWQSGQSTIIVQPKVVWFRNNLPTTLGTTISGFGTIFTVGVGLVRPLWRGEIVADLAYPFAGDNVVDDATGGVEREIVWSAGWRTPLGAEDRTWLSVYATNAAGPTPATSVIGTPGNDVGLGVSLGRSF